MTELVIVSAVDEVDLIAKMTRLIGFIDRVPNAPFVDVAYTCSVDSVKDGLKLAIVADNLQELRDRLFSARSRLETNNPRRIRDKSGTYFFKDHLLGKGGGKLAFVYPGAPGFYPDMMRDLVIAYPECREAFDELEEALADNNEFIPSNFIFPPAPYYRHDADIFKSGAYAQALVSTYAANVAMTRLLKRIGVEPDGVVGFAGGDLSAMMRSGAVGKTLKRSDRVGMIKDIYNIVHTAVNHGGFQEVVNVSVLLRREGDIDEVIKTFPPDKVRLAVNFSPRQKTFSVMPDFIDEAMAAFTGVGARVMRIPQDRPFNTELCEKLVPAIRKFTAKWMKYDSTCDVYSCMTGMLAGDSIKLARENCANLWANEVRFTETVRRMYLDGYHVFLEVGPRGLMTAAVSDTLKDFDHAAIAMNSIHRTGRLQAQHALAQLSALGANIDISSVFTLRHAKLVDFDAAISMQVRRDSEMKLSRKFPKITLLTDGNPFSGNFPVEQKGRGAKAAARAAAVAQQARRQRQFDFGAMNPLVSDADVIESTPGISLEVAKTFKTGEMPFIGDFALGTSQMSYADPNLRGLTLLTMPIGAEIMAEVAGMLQPNRNLLRIEDFECRRMVSFEDGELCLKILAERIASAKPSEVMVKVQIRDDLPDGNFTWPVMEATMVLSETPIPIRPAKIYPLSKPRSVHWSSRDIYPARICSGSRLRNVDFVEAWSESGIDYEMSVPLLSGAVTFTRFPMWLVNPLLLGVITSGFPLWRSHERIAGAFSFPFRLRRLEFSGNIPKEGVKLKGYLRLTGVTPQSHICDITVTSGNGQEVMTLSGWEELTERVPGEYRNLVLQPATTFITESFSQSVLGASIAETSSAYITDVPYPVFERNEGLWLRILSNVVLNADERKQFNEMSGSVSRRTEWLFGRIAAKEAVRKFLKDYYQARWSDADIRIWADGSGKPHALGQWNDFLSTKLDIAIAHTSQFVVAIAAANAKVGVDVESVMRNLSDEFANGVFTPEERELAARTANSSQSVIRFWCAKEAVSKALGTGIRYSPKGINIVAYDPEPGELVIRLNGEWLTAFPVFKGRDINVTVKTMRDHALAFCFIPSAYFNEN